MAAAAAGVAADAAATAPADAKGAASGADSKAAVLAEATNPRGPVVVQVLEAKRATADTVRITLAFTSRAAPPADAAAAQGGGPATVPLFGEADPADFCLITADGARRLFLLRGPENKPALEGNLQPLQPGERRIVLATFPAPPAPPTPTAQAAAAAGQPAVRATLLLGKLALRDVPISPQ